MPLVPWSGNVAARWVILARVRFATALVSCSLALLAARASASTLDDHGKLVASNGAAVVSFDDGFGLAAWSARITRWQGNPWQAQLVSDPIVDGAPFVGRTVPATEAIEGNGALRLGLKYGDATGVLIPGAAIAARVKSARFTVNFWGKSDGATPYLSAGWSTATPYGDDFVKVVALRTGRESSDGWVEYTTGAIDAQIWGVPLSGLLIAASPWAGKATCFAVDALEIVPEPGSGVAPHACTQDDVDITCGAEGDCQYGHCIPGYASWGPLPPIEHRKDLVERWIHLATRVHGDRASHERSKALVQDGPPLAWYSTASRPFFAGLHRLVNALRDQHTTFGGPTSALFSPIAYGGGSATVGACFGPGRHDLLAAPGSAGDLGFVVYRAAKFSPVGVPLRRGDALTAIDGQKPIDWVKKVWGTYAPSLPNDPGADFGWSAQGLSWLIEKRASTIEITRCLSDARCDGDYRQVLTIDVASPIFRNLQGTGSVGPLNGYFWCDIRFQDAIDTFAKPVSGEDTVSGQVVRGDVLAIEFDGTYGVNTWSSSMQKLFDPGSPPAKVLFDTRQGNGGHIFNAETVVSLIRKDSEPIGTILAPVGGWDGESIATILSASKSCADSPGSSYACGFSDVWFTRDAAPAGGSARVAFLNTADVSANDFLARLVKGRSNLRIFGPGPTSGAFGSISSLPNYLVGWGGGSMQMQDSLFGAAYADLGGATWESGKGVQPDEVIAQTMSDAIRDRDTMVEAAHAWLAKGAE